MFTTEKGMMPVLGDRLAEMSGTSIGIGRSSSPLRLVSRIAIADPPASVMVIATSFNGNCALLVNARTCRKPCDGRKIPPFVFRIHVMLADYCL